MPTSTILEMMADTGADCIEPLDPLGDVDVADAKRRVGRRVALMGGVNTLTLLNTSPHEVYEEATACCRAGTRNGGYILAAGDMVHYGLSTEQIATAVGLGARAAASAFSYIKQAKAPTAWGKAKIFRS